MRVFRLISEIQPSPIYNWVKQIELAQTELTHKKARQTKTAAVTQTQYDA